MLNISPLGTVNVCFHLELNVDQPCFILYYGITELLAQDSFHTNWETGRSIKTQQLTCMHIHNIHTCIPVYRGVLAEVYLHIHVLHTWTCSTK